jgi:altronate dehydratase large subunit
VRSFAGYVRPDGRVGVRNDVLVMSLMDNVNGVTLRIAQQVRGTVALPVWYGRGQYGRDQALMEQTLVGLAGHPNVAAAVLVSLEGVTAERLAERVRACGKPVRTVVVNEHAGSPDAVRAGVEAAAGLVMEASALRRAEVGLDRLVLGVECGGTDTTSGIASNPVTGAVADAVVDAGGTVLLSETSEFLGAEHILAERARDPEVARRIRAIVDQVEQEALRRGVDIRGANPVPDNIRGGITTIEEKSLGAILKGGTRTVQEVVDYGRPPTRRGLVIMDTPAPAAESLTGLVAAGAQAVIFTTGQGNVVGATLAPTVKVCANALTVRQMRLNVDVDVSGVTAGLEGPAEAAERLLSFLLEVCSGRMTASEVLGDVATVIPKLEPTV